MFRPNVTSDGGCWGWMGRDRDLICDWDVARILKMIFTICSNDRNLWVLLPASNVSLIAPNYVETVLAYLWVGIALSYSAQVGWCLASLPRIL